MKARSILIILLFGGSLAALMGFLLLRSGARAPHGANQPPNPGLPAPIEPRNGSTVTSAPVPSSALSREVPTVAHRLARLERLGQVPEDADDWDWWYAQETTWWGKRLDPRAFWTNRVLWLDRSASMAAQRHGREYPPIPYGDPSFASRSDVDESTVPGADTTGIRYRVTDKENAFWDKFGKTHPRPPEDIGWQQAQLAREILGSRYGFEHDGGRPWTTAAELAGMDAIARSRVQTLGYPAEALTDDALHWTYVLEKRAEYEQQFVRIHGESTLYSSNFLARLWVDPKLITVPLTKEQLKAANAWKIAYLQRLRKENTDESYINAYLAAWNLSPAAVFGGTNGP